MLYLPYYYVRQCILTRTAWEKHLASVIQVTGQLEGSLTILTEHNCTNSSCTCTEREWLVLVSIVYVQNNILCSYELEIWFTCVRLLGDINWWCWRKHQCHFCHHIWHFDRNHCTYLNVARAQLRIFKQITERRRKTSNFLFCKVIQPGINLIHLKRVWGRLSAQ